MTKETHGYTGPPVADMTGTIPDREKVATDYTLQKNRLSAVSTLQRLIKEPSDRLYEYQHAVLPSLLKTYASGRTTGHIELPPRTGKTHVALELATALGLKTLIVVPYKLTSAQFQDKATRYYTDEEVSQYLAGNTTAGEFGNSQIGIITYASLHNLIKAGKIDTSAYGLIVYDEFHQAMGPEWIRTVYTSFPSALLLGITATPFFERKLASHLKSGAINRDDRWLHLFLHRIHSMSITEAIDTGEWADLRVMMVDTRVVVDNEMRVATTYNVDEEDTPEFLVEDLEANLGTENRDALILAMLLGTNVVSDAHFTDLDQKNELESIHQTIRGKKVMISGISIDHIINLHTKLVKLGGNATLVHSKQPNSVNKRNLEAYEEGEFDIILGVGMLTTSWDSPDTEVAILTAPRRGKTKLIQEAARVATPHPTKKEGIVIQLIDTFRKNNALLVPEVLVDTELKTVAERVTESLESQRYGNDASRDGDTDRDKTRITFEGSALPFVFEIKEQRFAPIVPLPERLAARMVETTQERQDRLKVELQNLLLTINNILNEMLRERSQENKMKFIVVIQSASSEVSKYAIGVNSDFYKNYVRHIYTTLIAEIGNNSIRSSNRLSSEVTLMCSDMVNLYFKRFYK